MTEEEINELNDKLKEKENKKPLEKYKKGKGESQKHFIIRICEDYVKDCKLYIVNDQIFYKDGRRYSNDPEGLARLLYRYYKYTKSEYDEIIFQITKLATKYNETNMDVILLSNGGFLNYEFIKGFNIFCPYYIDVDYDENAYDEYVDSFLQTITCNENSKEKNDLRLVLEEVIGHCLMTKNFPSKMFILLGTGANGKSTFMNMLFNLFGDLAVNVPINKLDRDDYVARLTNKLVNISDDVDFDYIKSSQNLKTLASGDNIVARELYQKAYNFKNKATLIFSLNEMVLFADNSFGLQRRLCIIPFLHNIKDPNPSYIDLLTSDNAKKYLLKLGYEGLQRIISNGNKITESQQINDLVNNYIFDTNSALSFIEKEYKDDLDGKIFSNVYQEYENYCTIAGYDPYSKNKFSRILTSRGYTSEVNYIGDKPVRCITKIKNVKYNLPKKEINND